MYSFIFHSKKHKIRIVGGLNETASAVVHLFEGLVVGRGVKMTIYCDNRFGFPMLCEYLAKKWGFGFCATTRRTFGDYPRSLLDKHEKKLNWNRMEYAYYGKNTIVLIYRDNSIVRMVCSSFKPNDVVEKVRCILIYLQMAAALTVFLRLYLAQGREMMR